MKSYNWILIQNKNEKEARKERINRLEKFSMAIASISKVFWYVAEYKYQNIDFKTTEEKIRFLQQHTITDLQNLKLK